MNKPNIEAQKAQLKELFENSEYQLVWEDGLIEELRIKLSIFNLCMQRTIAGGFDPPNEDEMKRLCEFWHELDQNLRVAIDILDMAGSTASGFSYDFEKNGGSMEYRSLKDVLENWKS